MPSGNQAIDTFVQTKYMQGFSMTDFEERSTKLKFKLCVRHASSDKASPGMAGATNEIVGN